MEFTLNDYISITVLSILTLVGYRCTLRSRCYIDDIIDVKKFTSKYKYPPGPKGYPILGVAGMIPPDHPGLILSKWAREYGEMMTLKLGGMTWVFLNSSRVTKEILERRSGVYAFRM